LDTSCLWILGKSWKLGQGNIAIESSGEDSIRSGYFKAPLASFLEFDLWMRFAFMVVFVKQVFLVMTLICLWFKKLRK
jgi:hypothetical protein